MDLTNLTLTGLVAIGLVNVVSFFVKDLKPEVKFAIAFTGAFLVTFIPQDLSNLFLNNAKIAIEAAFMSSGVYKLFQTVKQ